MRVTNDRLITDFINAISSRKKDIAKLQQHVSTNKQILSPSDDPDGAVRAMALRASLARMEQMQTTFETSRRHLSILDTTLSEISSTLVEAKAAAVQGGNDTNGASERTRIATRVDGLIRDLVGVANTRIDGDYIFGGTDTTTPPYTTTEADGRVTAVTMNPSPTAEQQRDIGDGVLLSINMPGDRVFNREVNTFDVLIRFRDALNANDPEAIRTAITDAGTALEQASRAAVEIGNRLRRLDLVQQQRQDEEIELQAAQSKIEDIDVAKIFLQLRSSETSLQAAMTVGSRLLPQSLLDFLQ